MNVLTTTQLAGRFKIEAFRTDAEGAEIPGTRRIAADWFDNLITNAGLDVAGSTATSMAGILAACRVGSGSATPAVSDTALQSEIASTTTLQAETQGVQGAAPYFGWRRKTFRFGTGAAAGNLSEVGIFTADTGGTCWSRALIVDGGGVPTTITVLADETLDVTYELRMYPSADTPWSGVISAVSYSGTQRASFVTSDSAYNSGGPLWVMDGGSFTGCIHTGYNMSNTAQAYNGSLGAITGSPSGSASTASSVTASAYTPGSFFRDHAVTFGLNNGNLAGGITALRFCTRFGMYQLSCSPALPKDNTKTLKLTVRVAWARHTP